MKLQLDSITKNVDGIPHLYEMSLTFAPGLNVLLGPTQAGKTSLMRLLAGLDRPTIGRLLEDGKDITSVPVQKRNVAFVYQQFINYPSLTVFENIASPLRVQGGLSSADIKQRVQATAALMRIDHLLDRLPTALSGGQQQRTAIARALIKQAPLLLLDEPLVNLDYKLREELRAEMQNIFAQRNAIVVYSTTEPLEALLLGGTIMVLDQGRLLQTGPTLEVYHQPALQRVGEVFSDPPMNLLSAQIQGNQLQLVHEFAMPTALHIRNLPAGAYQIGVRANHVTFAPSTADDIAITSRVELAEISGSQTYIHLVHREQGTAGFRVVAELEGVHPYEPGQTATFYLDPKRLYAFDARGRLAAAPARGSRENQAPAPNG
ncbi:MAG: ABC transporter ATP-binding protein [Caldilineaceae bacterium]